MIGTEEERRSGGESAPPCMQKGFDQKAGISEDPNLSLAGASKLPGDSCPAARTLLEMDFVTRFAALFAGHDSVYGCYNGIADQPDENGKLLGTDRRTVRDAVTPALYEKHLAGTNGLGIVPIKLDSTVCFGAIDIDVYDGLSHAAIAKKLANAKIPLVVCRSKSGGAHIYCFTAEPVPAKMMVAKLKEVASMLGYGNAEIFPKQLAMAPGDAGSWINLPYYNGVMEKRYAVQGDRNALDLPEFLDEAERLRQSLPWFKKPLVVSAEMPQGPPCLQHLIQIGFPQGTRNSGLYNLGVYCRKVDGDNWGDLLEEMNQKYMQPPLDAAEVKTVTGSVKKKDYNYSCSQHPIAAHCNSTQCRSRKYGIGRGNSGFPEIGRVRKIKTDPVTWFVEVNGSEIKLITEQFQDPNLFQKASMEKLTECPTMPDRKAWSALVQKSLSPENVTEEDAPEDLTLLGQFRELVADFCTSRAQANSREEILLGKPWTNDGLTWFRVKDLTAHLDRRKYKVELAKLADQLKAIGAKNTKTSTRIKGKPERLWSVPEFAKQTEPHDIPESITEERPF